VAGPPTATSPRHQPELNQSKDLILIRIVESRRYYSYTRSRPETLRFFSDGSPVLQLVLQYLLVPIHAS
jgi:hypothetical protein